MRKTLWACAASVVVGAVFNILIVEYACDHPNSWLGRCFFTAHRVAVSQVKAVAATSRAAELTFHGMQGLFNKGTGGVCDDGGKCPVHDEPVAEAEPPMEPAVLPGGVVLPEDEAGPPAEPMPPVHDLIGERPLFGGIEDCEEFVMPRAGDDAVPMPFVEEGPKSESRPATKDHSEASSVMPGCQAEDAHTHRKHHSHKEPPKASPGGSEECEPVFPQMQRDGGETPKHPDVDTMEVRPSDLRFFDYTGPF
jgi:hypothetical protein